MNRQTALFFAIATSFCVLASSPNAMGQTNLLLNPSFEAGNGISADSWGNFAAGSGTTQRRTAFSHQGSYSFRFSSAGYTEFPHTSSTPITAIPRATYDVSMWGLYDTFAPLDSTHSADCKATFYDAGGNQLSFTESYFLTTADPVDTWKQTNFALTAPSNAASLVLQLGVAAGTYSNAAVYFDDGRVTLAPVLSLSATAPTSFGSSKGTLAIFGDHGNYTVDATSFAPASTGYVRTSAWNPTTDAEVYGLKIADSVASNLSSDLAYLAAEINGGSYSGYSITASTTDPTGGVLANFNGGGFNFFVSVTNPSLGAGSDFLGFNLNQFNGNGDVLTVSAIDVVPEPATTSLLLVGGAALLMRRRKTRLA